MKMTLLLFVVFSFLVSCTGKMKTGVDIGDLQYISIKEGDIEKITEDIEKNDELKGKIDIIIKKLNCE